MTLARLEGGGLSNVKTFTVSPAIPTLSLFLFLSRPSAALSATSPSSPSRQRRNHPHFLRRGSFTQLSPSDGKLDRPTAQAPRPRDHLPESRRFPCNHFLLTTPPRIEGTDRDGSTPVLFLSNDRHNFVVDAKLHDRGRQATDPRKWPCGPFSRKRIRVLAGERFSRIFPGNEADETFSFHCSISQKLRVLQIEGQLEENKTCRGKKRKTEMARKSLVADRVGDRPLFSFALLGRKRETRGWSGLRR